MNLLERYIFRRTLSLSLMTLSATTVMVLITQVLIYVNLLTASGQALLTFFTLAATLIPPMLNLVMPFALHIGATQTLNGMNSDSELAVIEAAGGSRSIQTKPIVLLAIMMALAGLALSHFVEPFAYKHKRDIIARAGADLVRFAVQSGTFQEIEPNLFVQIADQLPSGDFEGIFIADSRKPDTDLVYYAKHGAIHQNGDAEVLVLADGEVQRKNSQTGDLSVISFESYVLDFNQFGPSSGEVNYSSKERSTAYLLFAPRTDDFFMRNKPEDVRAEINRRFSEWLYPLVFGTIAIYFAVGARSNRQERLWSLTAGVAVALAVRGAGFFLVNVSGINSLYTFLNFAIPIGSILLFSTLILMDKSLRFSQAWVEGAGSIAARLTRWWTNVRFGGGALQSPGGGPAMIGHTLFLYFFRRYVATFVQFFLGVSVISYLVDFTEFSRFKSTLPGYTIGGGLLVSALRIPLITQTAIPFIILFSAIATLMALNRRYELVVARSAGVSAWQFLAPLCLASMLIGIVVVTVFNPLGARALAWAQQLEASFSEKAQSDFDVRIPWLRQRNQDGVTIIGAKSTADRGRQLNEATFIQIDRSGGIVDRIDARQATLGDGVWLIDGAVRRARGGAPERLDRIELKTSLRPEFVEEKLARPETIPFFELPRKMQAAWSFGLNANGFGMQYHSLIALPMLMVAMTLIAATVSMRFARMGQSATMILGGVVAGFLLYVISVLVKAFGTAGIVPPFVAAWIPVVVAMFFGVTFLLYKEDG